MNTPAYERFTDLVSQSAFRQLSYLSEQKLQSVYDTCRHMEHCGLPGIVIEAGCGLGGSTIMIANGKGRERPLYVYDVFSMIPAPTSEDGEIVFKRYQAIKSGESPGIGGNMYYGYEQDLYRKVSENLQRFGVDTAQHNIHLIKGMIQDTLNVAGPIAFAHIDVDWYEPVLICLQRITPHLVPGGSIIIDDFYDWPGCRRATREYFACRKDDFFTDNSAGSLKITRR